MFLQEVIIHNINNEDCNYSCSDILLDSGSSYSVFNNDEILENTKDSDTTLRCYINGGHQENKSKD